MTRFLTTTGVFLVIAVAGISTPGLVTAFPLSGTYETVPGSSTSQGPFTATGSLVVDEDNGTATFQIGATIYNGSFLDPATLRITRCSVAPGSPSSERVDWTFLFDTNTSFAWTGTTRTYVGQTCSGGLLSVIDYTNVRMVRAADPMPLPDSGLYESVPGSSTSEGPFSATGVLTVDATNASATFQIGNTVYSGDFVSNTTIEFNACVALGPTVPQSELAAWTFEFDTSYSFWWTGTSTLYVQSSCSVVHSMVEYTNVRMVLSGTVGSRSTTWGGVKSMYR